MQIKPTVRLGQLTPQIVLALLVVQDIWPRPVTLTSANDSKHTGSSATGIDPHYLGRAVDIRIHDIPMDQRAATVQALEDELGPEYLVIWESVGTPNEHVHIQYQGE